MKRRGRRLQAQAAPTLSTAGCPYCPLECGPVWVVSVLLSRKCFAFRARLRATRLQVHRPKATGTAPAPLPLAFGPVACSLWPGFGCGLAALWTVWTVWTLWTAGRRCQARLLFSSMFIVRCSRRFFSSSFPPLLLPPITPSPHPPSPPLRAPRYSSPPACNR